jgi:uncharacterized membrane protein
MTFAIDSLGGIPAHPLLVHAPVVLVPLAALCALGALLPRTRRFLLWAGVWAAGAGLIGAWLAGESGEALEDSVRETAALERHTELGEQVTPLVAVFLVFLVVSLLLHLARRGGIPYETRLTPLTTRLMPRLRALPATAVSAILVATVAAGALATWKTVDAGHSGAESVWDGVTITHDEGRGDDGYDD